MAKPRVTATDRLSNVIEVVQMGRRSGLLSVERGAGTILEVGEIFFVSGSPTYAALSSLRGREALAALAQWGDCRFAFDGNAARPAANITPTNPALRSRPSDPAVQHREADRWSYSPGAPGHVRSSLPFGTGTGPLPANTNGHSTTNSLQKGLPSSRTQPLDPSQSGILRQYGGSDYSRRGTTSLEKRPRRAPDVRDLMNVVTAHNLSRNHRTVLLLADGEHTILDLARLSSKTVDEITTLLADLELRGLIYYYAVE
ncbi:MAG: DUF4388 domain-containing protein [Ktedonobacterales bacterium]